MPKRGPDPQVENPPGVEERERERAGERASQREADTTTLETKFYLSVWAGRGQRSAWINEPLH